jgi:hypothetical protein
MLLRALTNRSPAFVAGLRIKRRNNMAPILLVFAYGLVLYSAAYVHWRRAEIIALAAAKCTARNLSNTYEGR